MAEEHQDDLLEPVDVANALLEAIEKDEFLVLPHAVVHAYSVGRAKDHSGWLKGMVKFRRSLKPENMPL